MQNYILVIMMILFTLSSYSQTDCIKDPFPKDDICCPDQKDILCNNTNSSLGLCEKCRNYFDWDMQKEFFDGAWFYHNDIMCPICGNLIHQEEQPYWFKPEIDYFVLLDNKDSFLKS